MSHGQLHAVFLALIVSRLRYTLPAWSGFLSREQVGQINAFLKRIYRCGLSCELIQLETLTSTVLIMNFLLKCVVRFTAFILCCYIGYRQRLYALVVGQARCSSHRTRDHRWPCVQFNCSSNMEQFTKGSAVFRVTGHFSTPPEN